MDKELLTKLNSYKKDVEEVHKKSSEIELKFMNEVIRPLLLKEDYETLLELFDQMPECFNRFVLWQELEKVGKIQE
jgi:hypothetical protein